MIENVPNQSKLLNNNRLDLIARREKINIRINYESRLICFLKLKYVPNSFKVKKFEFIFS